MKDHAGTSSFFSHYIAQTPVPVVAHLGFGTSALTDTLDYSGSSSNSQKMLDRIKSAYWKYCRLMNTNLFMQLSFS